MNFYLLIYHVVDDYITRRAAYREEHLQLAGAAHKSGKLLLGGALSDPSDQAVLLFRADNTELVRDFVRLDPYVRNGIVKHWEIRKWNVVIGGAPGDRA